MPHGADLDGVATILADRPTIETQAQRLLTHECAKGEAEYDLIIPSFCSSSIFICPAPGPRFGAPAPAGVRNPGVRGARSSKSFCVGRRDWVRAGTAGVCTEKSSSRITAACTREPKLGGASSSERSSLNPPSSSAFHPMHHPPSRLLRVTVRCCYRRSCCGSYCCCCRNRRHQRRWLVKATVYAFQALNGLQMTATMTG